MSASAPLSGIAMYSAFAPVRTPKTRSPTANSLTARPDPLDLTRELDAGNPCFGRRRPVTKRLMKNSALRSPVSVRVTVVARTLTSTSSSPGTGRSSVSIRRTSGGPYRS